MMNIDDKSSLSERDICSKFITPALQQSGWDIDAQIREEVSLTPGRVIIRGKLMARGTPKRADYVLYYKPNIPIAVIEAKDNKHSIGDGMQQALGYAEMLSVPFSFSSNGDGFLMHDSTGKGGKVETELALNAFPSPEQLWEKYCLWKGIPVEQRHIVTQDYYSDGNGKSPRYYQLIAINQVMEAIAKGQDRLLLVMATGTGKTFTAFQIIWRLWKAGVKKRILFLADRNILVDQTRINDFKPFGSHMTKITNRTVDKSFEVYLSLYQAVTGTEEESNIYKQFSPDFFDFIVIDECHRGSAAEDSAWREILDYFSSATHLGLTATPRETKDISNITYFGEPVYTYSLKQGIEDGFLAPYKVVRIDLDKDLTGYRPPKGKLDKFGEEIEDRIYNQKDFDKTLVLDKRTEVVAQKVTEFLKATNRFDKTIVFCEDIEHAERMRQALVNCNADLAGQNAKYIMRITGDNPEGKAQLDSFIDPESRYPVVVTTSKLLNTGVDAQTCKLIVLDQRIESMTCFKQIIGRGTRIREDYGKFFFSIMDFKKATELFADPGFDGDPVVVYVPKPNEPPVPPDEPESTEAEGEPNAQAGFICGGEIDDLAFPPALSPNGTPLKRRKYYINDVAVSVVAERVQYYDKDGKLITESLKGYTRKKIKEQFKTLNDFLHSWSKSEQKAAIIAALQAQGVMLDALADEVGNGFDPFDLVCHVAFDQPPLTRQERAENVRKRNYFAKYGEQARLVLDALLEKYADSGVENIEKLDVLKIPPLCQFGTPMEIIERFGGKDKYLAALKELEAQLYPVA